MRKLARQPPLRSCDQPAPATFFGDEFQEVKNYGREEPITWLRKEFQGIQFISVPVGRMNPSEKKAIRRKA